MCKVLIMSGIKAKHKVMAGKFIREMGKEMSTANRDGLGYAAVDKDGKLFGERWLINADAFGGENETKIKPFAKALATTVGSVKGESNSFGEGQDLSDAVAITLHTRMATSPKNMMNVHPFVYPEMDTSLIHNGVISNDADFKKFVSTCDSEAILSNYLDHSVNLQPTASAKMAEALNGYYACGVFSRNHEGVRILDVFKGNGANLYLQEVKELEVLVFATSDDDVKRVCERLGLTRGQSYRVHEGNLMRLNPFTGELMQEITEFKVPVQNSYHRGSHSPARTSGYNNTSSNIMDWKRDGGGAGTHSNSTGGIIDVSISGQRERQRLAGKAKGETMTQKMIDMMSLSPKIRELSRQEVTEEMRILWGKQA